MATHDLSEAFERFTAYILKSPVKEHIVKIILFGSQAKATATKDSDIDVLIFTSNGKTTNQRVMDDVYDFMLKEPLPFEVVTAHIDELIAVQDYFLYTALHSGIEVYSMEKSDVKKIMIRDLLHLCEEYLDSSKDALAIQRVRMAIDAAYNAAELATKALILLEQDDLPGSHGGVVNIFSQLYIKTGKIEKEIGSTLHKALKLRNEARYRPDTMPISENARFVIDLAEQLMKIASDATLPLSG
ncbi:hypothetical protein U27_05702 [Candidatus Vecturithrix granuli]|uniref:HEPN domain-containing protein n=1 Tax=Vecturithrix granuli TaxID=1499967 RepID=A0A081C2C2_VECG1|nr:hypothetical protein U27_05702 [Candidatus Vecturithrix granuli]